MSEALGTILQLAENPRLLGSVFHGGTWRAWWAVLRALFVLPMSAADLATFTTLTGREDVPTTATRESWFFVGRRGGKSVISALIAVYATCCRTYRLAPGEVGVFMVIAADRRQARVVKRYIAGLLRSSPSLAALIARETKESLTLTTGLVIEIHTASFRTLRGYTVIGAVCDEVCFWQTDESANPDVEILTALRAAMATVPEALLCCISSPYARRGEAWRIYRQYFGQPGAPVLVVKAPTRVMNPNVPQATVDAAYAEDPVRAASEFGAEFRDDVSAFLTLEALEAVTIHGRTVLPPIASERYVGFVDPAGSGGSGADSFTAAVAHRSGEKMVLDAVFEKRPPFSPEDTVAEMSTWLQQYRIREVTGDRYAGEWPREAFRRHGAIAYRPSELSKSDLYREVLPLISSGAVELLDMPRLQTQARGLERRVSRGGRELIDHGPSTGAHDDLINAAAGALVLAARRPRAAAVFYDLPGL